MLNKLATSFTKVLNGPLVKSCYMPPRLILRLEVLLSTSLFLFSPPKTALFFRLPSNFVASPRIFSIALLYWSGLFSASASAQQAANLTEIRVGEVQFQAEIAQTLQERRQGLMFRTHLPDRQGMLFIQPTPAPANFWMKNTLISLDLLYFDSDRRLLQIHADVPPCKKTPCPVYSSETADIKYIFEISGGQAERLGIKPGDRLSLH